MAMYMFLQQAVKHGKYDIITYYLLNIFMNLKDVKKLGKTEIFHLA